MCFAFSSVKTYKAKKLAIVFKQEIILRGVMIFTFQSMGCLITHSYLIKRKINYISNFKIELKIWVSNVNYDYMTWRKHHRIQLSSLRSFQMLNFQIWLVSWKHTVFPSLNSWFFSYVNFGPGSAVDKGNPLCLWQDISHMHCISLHLYWLNFDW